MTSWPRRRARFRRSTVLSLAVLIVLIGAGTAYATVSAPGPAYRLATVTPAQVDSAIETVGTLSPVQQADVPFPVSGTVSAVDVHAGQRVTAGQLLGTLSKTALRAELTAAQSTLAEANLQVSHDMTSQDQAASGSGSGSGSGAGSGSGSAGKSARAALRPRQQAVLRAQRRADRALAQARLALAQASHVCASQPPSPAPSPSMTPSLSGRASPAPTLAPTPTATPMSALGSCAHATRRVLAAETVLLDAQQALSRQLTALSTALARAIAADTGSGRGGGSGPSTGGSSAGPGGAGHPSGAVSAAQLAADQATADADAAQLTVAQQDLANAAVRSPIGGTVIGVEVSPGTAVTAGSSAFEIAGLDSYQVQTEVPVTELPSLKVGQRASVQADGLSHPLTGSVLSIGLTPDTSNSPVTYPVTIGLTGLPGALHANGFANVTISTGHSHGVSVPTSAVHYAKHAATVTVYAADRTRTVRVTVGTRGLVRTQITAGLKVGQQVVLANLSQPLPTNNLNQGPAFGEGIGPGGRTFIVGP